MKVEDFLTQQKTKQEAISYQINKIKEKDEYVILFLDDEKLYISVESYFRYSINKVEGLSENLYQLLKQEERILLAYRRCLRKLAMKDMSEKQIKDYLFKMELNKKDINEIIQKLTSYGFINDEQYCLNKIQSNENSLVSYQSLKEKLKKDGIDRNLIEDHLQYDYSTELNKAEKLAVKYDKNITNYSVNAKRMKIMQKLQNSGFSYDLARQATDQLEIDSSKEIILLEKEYQKCRKKYERKYEDYPLKQKIYAALLQKGFKAEDIKKVMEV